MLRHLLKISLFVFFPVALFAQVSNYISSVKLSDAKEGAALTFKADLLNTNDISEITLAYRVFGASEFVRVEMDIWGPKAEVTIPGEKIKVPSLEYYFIVSTRNNTTEYYPIDAVNQNYLMVQVQPRSEKDDEVLVLSPDPGTELSADEALITLSLLKADESVDKTKTKIYINGTDVTSSALFADDLIILAGEELASNLKKGSVNSMRVELYKEDGTAYHSLYSGFDVTDELGGRVEGTSFKYFFNVRAESRNENVRDNNNWYNNFSFDGKATYGGFDLDASVYATSEEKGYLQPYNRYKVSISNEYFNIIGGDYTPSYQSLIMNGKRVRGVNGSIHLGFFNLQASYGEINRGIDGSILNILPPNSSLLGPNLMKLSDGSIAEIKQGTFKRDVLAINPYFTAGETFKFGLTYLHSKDDYASAAYTRGPQENLVVGTDLALNFDDGNIQLYGQGAFSVINKDIATGTIADSTIDKLFGEGKIFGGSSDDIKKIKDIINQFITFNQFLSPLKPEELSSLAYEASLSLNYFGNYLKGSYISRGFDYFSFGNNYLRTDVSGINIFDRVSLLDNKLFVTLGYENLKDNRNKTKFATTSFTTFNASVSYYPSFDLPGFILSFTRNENNNGILRTASDSLFAIDDYTNRFGAQVTYRFFAGYNHNLSVNASFSGRIDNTINKFDANNNMFGLNYSIEWSKVLQSSLNLNYSSNEIINGLSNVTTVFNITSLVLGSRYYLMDNKLILNGAVSPTFGDIQRTAIDATAQYFILKNFSLQFQFRYLINDAVSNDSIAGLTARYEFR
ncbi:MAG: hypothetical protein LC102_10530 [Ignavibacteriales bacterium]|nr:MAG: hypothetical protein F9K26_10470 [Ignavibacteriaceae bacterium]MBW7873620.1 hypothetical protein [Ignavibacteria bacterium]MCZ2143850.1 hypothetical protein [Ignavibacteriales bacterium]OQY71287.1 MAG: hypothetical protein B6D45_10230 [Ignavibacteriales bacterium UTCHB3]MBV6445879.1 hypothetical protein [Ignavibacteriaceae bacterium]